MEDIKKIEKRAELLLDLGKRNNSINFKDTKASTLEVLIPNADELFKKLPNCSNFNIIRIDFENDEKTKEEYKNEYLNKRRNEKDLVVYNSSGKATNALKNIRKKGNENLEETGVNVLYIAFGFISWKESDESDIEYKSPLLLFPISLEQEKIYDKYTIKIFFDEMIFNPALEYKVKNEYNVSFPCFENFEDLEDYFNEIENLFCSKKWHVLRECKIGIFSFSKINMYHDLVENKEIIASNSNIKALLGEKIEKDNNYDNFSYEKINPVIDLHNVVDADSSQIEAILKAKAGKSFVLQGPPGTGKSQTITNIIAEALYDGKTILFVSEKRAALNVVYDNLKKAGLNNFCLELHSYKTNKKEFINEIYNSWNCEKKAIKNTAMSEIEEKKNALKKLDEYNKELHETRPVIKKSLYQIFEKYSALKDVTLINFIIDDISSKGEDYLLSSSNLIEEYTEYIPSIGYNYKENYWYGYIYQDNSYFKLEEIKKYFINVVNWNEKNLELEKEIFDNFSINCNCYEDLYNTYCFLKFISESTYITLYFLDKDKFNLIYKLLPSLKELSDDILANYGSIYKAYKKTVYEIHAEEYLEIVYPLSRRRTRVFNKKYKKIRKVLKKLKYKGKRPSYKEVIMVLQKVKQYQKSYKCFNAYEKDILNYLGKNYHGINTNWKKFIDEASLLKNKFYDKNQKFGNLRNYKDLSSKKDEFIKCSKHISSSIFEINREKMKEYFDISIFNIRTSSSSVIKEKLKGCIENFDKLNHWNNFRFLLEKLKNNNLISYIDLAINENVKDRDIVSCFKKIFYFTWIQFIYSKSELLTSFPRIIHDKAIKDFKEKDIEQFEINKCLVKSALFDKYPPFDDIVSNDKISILKREAIKKRNIKTIRTLMNEIGDIIKIIKPCFLMSPLSVSTFLNPQIKFDLIIFDEASQIFTQDAVGSIYRGRQLTVVGDAKQMPPSNFFNASIDIDTEDEESESYDLKDFESVLDLCTASYPTLSLNWHYRSKFEQLISFSNKNFYNNHLITFPSIFSSTLKKEGIGVNYYFINGTFDRKSHTNRIEAEYVVDLIFKNIDSFPDRSLGVVAFSVAQQNLIDDVLEKRLQKLPQYKYYFEENESKRDKFFIKNLETVQGDERDTIIFSVAYGPDNQNKILHNFGPLNKEGGERRLNVAITRAKYNIKVVSSMHYYDIDYNRINSNGPRLLREYLDYAENGEIALNRSINVDNNDDFDSYFEMEVCEFLRSKGYCVDTQVGCSGYRIDLGLKEKNTSNYVLAIECDGATYHSFKNVRDRDRLRQQILEGMGWKFYRIWSTDWFNNKSIEKEKLLCAANEALNNKNNTFKKEEENNYDFEESIQNTTLKFPKYKAVDISNIISIKNFCAFINEILLVEAPISDELILKYVARFLNREKVSSVVKDYYYSNIDTIPFKTIGIIHKDDFLYLKDKNDFSFRVRGDIQRTIDQIAKEELADGLLKLLKFHKIPTEKKDLYLALIKECGFMKVTDEDSYYLDKALEILIKNNSIRINKENTIEFIK